MLAPRRGNTFVLGCNVLCEEQCANAYAAAEADLMSGITIEYTFHQITSCNACHVTCILYYCFISEKKASNIQRCSQAGGNVGEQVKTKGARPVIATEVGLLAAEFGS